MLSARLFRRGNSELVSDDSHVSGRDNDAFANDAPEASVNVVHLDARVHVVAYV